MSRVIRDFRTVLDIVARGRLTEKADSQLVSLLEAMEASLDETAKGQLQVTLSFQRIGEKIDISGAVKMTPPPEKKLPPSTLFVVEGGLSVQHPSQTDMFSGPRDAADRAKA